MAAEYEIIIKPGGVVESTLLKEDVNQRAACDQVIRLMNSLGNVTEHTPDSADPAPVNQGLFGGPGGMDGGSSSSNH